VVDKFAAALAKRLLGAPPEVEKLPGTAVPVEDEVGGENITYRVKLNPEIFCRYRARLGIRTERMAIAARVLLHLTGVILKSVFRVSSI